MDKEKSQGHVLILLTICIIFFLLLATNYWKFINSANKKKIESQTASINKKKIESQTASIIMEISQLKYEKANLFIEGRDVVDGHATDCMWVQQGNQVITIRNSLYKVPPFEITMRIARQIPHHTFFVDRNILGKFTKIMNEHADYIGVSDSANNYPIYLF